MKKTNIFLLLLIILIAGGWLIFSNEVTEFISQRRTEISQIEVKEEVSLIIDAGEGTSKTFQGEFREKMTAFDLLKEKTEELGLVLETKISDIGILIEVIGDKENGENGKYWLYYVNRKMPMVAADKKELKSGDKVEFKFEKPPF